MEPLGFGESTEPCGNGEFLSTSTWWTDGDGCSENSAFSATPSHHSGGRCMKYLVLTNEAAARLQPNAMTTYAEVASGSQHERRLEAKSRADRPAGRGSVGRTHREGGQTESRGTVAGNRIMPTPARLAKPFNFKDKHTLRLEVRMDLGRQGSRPYF